ncbi:uncharacterized protein LOC130014523 isoform X3 [Mercurialis annua]|nr:uncharacterized protein LOC130014523 isoform X3 [Mercurialis annua]XP_050209599.1 uncharacterized protein LOC130014523 isoform X3 [Mercurialis annua]
MILKFEIWRILGGLHSSMELPHHPRSDERISTRFEANGSRYLHAYLKNLDSKWDGMISFGKSSFRSFNSRKSFAQEVKEGFHSSSPQ